MTAPAAPPRPRSSLGDGTGTIIRAPNHLGDLVMAIPAIEALPAADVLIASFLAPLLKLARRSGAVLPMERDEVFRTAKRVRAHGYRSAVVLPPSFSSAAVMAFAGIPYRRGTATNARGLLLSDAIAVDPGTMHRASLYWLLATGHLPPTPPVPSLVPDTASAVRWGSLSRGSSRGAIGIFPGSNASSRRWPVERFAALCDRLVSRGERVIVFGGPNEVALTRAVAGERGLDLGGLTDLSTLAAGLASLRLLITNDSGPMHLAAAVGTPTISLWGAGNPMVTGPRGPSQTIVRHPELPCVPCGLNVCPRRGPGFVLPMAEIECLRLIEVGEVLEGAGLSA